MRPKTLAQYGAPTLAVVVIWAVIAGYPLVRDLGAADDRLDLASTERAALLASFEEVQGLPDRQEEIFQQMDELEVLVPDGVELGSLIHLVDQAGIMNGVAVENFSPSRLSDNSTLLVSNAMPEGISSVTIELVARGQYESMVGFLESLERLDRLVLLDSVDLHTDAESSLGLTAEIVLRVFTSATIDQSNLTDTSVDEALALVDGPDSAEGTVETPVLPPGLSEAEILEFLASKEGDK